GLALPSSPRRPISCERYSSQFNINLPFQVMQYTRETTLFSCPSPLLPTRNTARMDSVFFARAQTGAVCTLYGVDERRGCEFGGQVHQPHDLCKFGLLHAAAGTNDSDTEEAL